MDSLIFRFLNQDIKEMPAVAFLLLGVIIGFAAAALAFGHIALWLGTKETGKLFLAFIGLG